MIRHRAILLAFITASSSLACSSAGSPPVTASDGGADGAVEDAGTPDTGGSQDANADGEASSAQTKIIHVANMGPDAPSIGLCVGATPNGPPTTRLDIGIPAGIPFGAVVPLRLPLDGWIHAVDAASADCSTPIGAPSAITSPGADVTAIILHGRDGNVVHKGFTVGYDFHGNEPSAPDPGKVKLRIAVEIDGHYPTSLPPDWSVGLVSGGSYTQLASRWGAYDVVMIDPMNNASFGARLATVGPPDVVGTGFTMNAGETWTLYLVEHADDTHGFIACRDDGAQVGALEQCHASP